MVWPLLFAHLIADYPLQTDGMVQLKKSWSGLALHVSVHLLTLLVILNGVLRLPWSTTFAIVLTMTVLHFAIDAWKNVFTRRWPRWVIGGYLQDQALHLASILGVAAWYAKSSGSDPFAAPALWVIYGCGLILATHATFVTERVCACRTPPYQQWLTAHLWPRLMSRAALFALIWVGWNWWGLCLTLGALTFHWNDLAGCYRPRAVLLDSSITLVLVALTQLAAHYFYSPIY